MASWNTGIRRRAIACWRLGPWPGADGLWAARWRVGRAGRRRWFAWVAAALGVTVAVALLEFASARAMARYEGYEDVRALLMAGDDAALVHRQNVVSQAYLLYVPAPGFTSGGVEQHNAHAYRGPIVPLDRAPGKLRVLFMGGSTTYGWLIRRPEQTYPAEVGRILERTDLGPDIDGIEVINAGLPFGTSAEILTHYLFKYRYYRPDVLVLNTGGNDAQGTGNPRIYQPDYSHWRRTLPVLRPAAPGLRWLLHSNFVALFVVHGFFSEAGAGQHFVDRARTDRTIAWWYDRSRVEATRPPSIPESDLAFANNLETLLNEADADGVQVVVVPFRPRPEGNSWPASLLAEMARTEAVLLAAAERRGLPVAPFPGDLISPENWGHKDNCHLRPAGAREKAAHIAETLVATIRAGDFPRVRAP